VWRQAREQMLESRGAAGQNVQRGHGDTGLCRSRVRHLPGEHELRTKSRSARVPLRVPQNLHRFVVGQAIVVSGSSTSVTSESTREIAKRDMSSNRCSS